MTFAEEMEIIGLLLKALCYGGLIYTLFTQLKHIKENTAAIKANLEYIIDRMEQAEASQTLDDIEGELSAIREQLEEISENPDETGT